METGKPTSLRAKKKSQRNDGLAVEVSEESSEGSEPTTTNGETTTLGDGSSSDKVSLTHNESILVRRSKLIVYACLLAAAAAVGTLTYLFTTRDETGNFEKDFLAYGREVLDHADKNAFDVIGYIDALGIATTSYALTSDQTWPNVTLPHFDFRAREAAEHVNLELLMFAPIVKEHDRGGWEAYAREHQGWVEEGLRNKRESNGDGIPSAGPISDSIFPYFSFSGRERFMFDFHEKNDRKLLGTTNEDGEELNEYNDTFDTDFYLPLWMQSPAPDNATIINLDLNSVPALRQTIRDLMEVQHHLLSQVVNVDTLFKYTFANHTSDGHPRSIMFEPVFDKFESGENGHDGPPSVVAFMMAELEWEAFFSRVLPSHLRGIVVDVEGTCGESFTYVINGDTAEYVGKGDLHDPKYDHLELDLEFIEFARWSGDDDDLSGVHCEYTFKLYPTMDFEAPYHTNKPAVYTAVVVLIFIGTILVFATYDFLVARRQRKLLTTAERTTAIISSLFPKDVKNRILAEAEEQAEHEIRMKRKGFLVPKNQLKDFLHDENDVRECGQYGTALISKPIADLFPEATVMFADISGFTAWSSMREPSQVFTLLETIYGDFDRIAKRRRIFKVETVGDCYVAVAGLPEPRRDHAVAMARFARDCLHSLGNSTKRLEILLGPDTAELGMRFGLHSGPVTAGVLRGERARFQLFGDTVNTSARLESTGEPNRIQISQATADLLTIAGKGHWCHARVGVVNAKGKGAMSTYWLITKGDTAMSSRSGSSSESGVNDRNYTDLATPDTDPLSTSKNRSDGSKQHMPSELSDKSMRLVHWNTEILCRLLKEIIARREATAVEPDSDEQLSCLESDYLEMKEIAIDEVKDCIDLPQFDATAASKQRDAKSVKLDDDVQDQLLSYVQTIAQLYRHNPFHCFEHASHVTMSVTKLLSRIIAPDDIEYAEIKNVQDVARNEATLHDHTYGITSDPLTQFSVVLSALIHDVDHPGVSNSQLIKEQATISSVYKNKSIAEQNSIDIAWELLMQETFTALRRTIYTTAKELKRFRQLVVNTVLATDIMDKEINAARKARWNIAFAETAVVPSKSDSVYQDEVTNRKATIVIEHLIQASDVAHTMQHWHIYRKWNAKLFHEMYKAYVEGRSETDPSENWYQGEIGFFDFYIIPLAKKLRNCGVFGVSSDEYLNYAEQNRIEWESKGQQLVAEMVEEMKRKYRNAQDNADSATIPQG